MYSFPPGCQVSRTVPKSTDCKVLFLQPRLQLQQCLGIERDLLSLEIASPITIFSPCLTILGPPLPLLMVGRQSIVSLQPLAGNQSLVVLLVLREVSWLASKQDGFVLSSGPISPRSIYCLHRKQGRPHAESRCRYTSMMAVVSVVPLHPSCTVPGCSHPESPQTAAVVRNRLTGV